MPSILSDRQTIADLRRERDQQAIGFRLAKAAAVEWEVEKLASQVVKRDFAQTAWLERMALDRAPWAVLSKPLARRCVGKDTRKISALLTHTIHEALHQLADALHQLAEGHPEKR